MHILREISARIRCAGFVTFRERTISGKFLTNYPAPTLPLSTAVRGKLSFAFHTCVLAERVSHLRGRDSGNAFASSLRERGATAPQRVMAGPPRSARERGRSAGSVPAIHEHRVGSHVSPGGHSNTVLLVAHHAEGDECIAENHASVVFVDGRDNRPAMTNLSRPK